MSDASGGQYLHSDRVQLVYRGLGTCRGSNSRAGQFSKVWLDLFKQPTKLH
jgi:hypothetical protein